MPWRDSIRHADGRVDKGIRLFPDAYQELTDNMGLPCQLCRVGNMLPLAATVGQWRIGTFNPFGCGSQDFQQVCPCMSTPLFNNLYLYFLTGDSSGDKKYTSLVAAYSVSSVSQIC